MKQIELGYGHGSQSLSFDEDRFRVLAACVDEDHPLSDAEIGAALDEPIGSPGIEDLLAAHPFDLVAESRPPRRARTCRHPRHGECTNRQLAGAPSHSERCRRF